MNKTCIALMKAADHIERYPEHFRFQEVMVPTKPEQGGCAIGLTAYFAGYRKSIFGTRRIAGNETSQKLFGVSMMEFFDRLHHLEEKGVYWSCHPLDCAKVLRAYAARYHGIPLEIQRIFDQWTPSPSPVKSPGGLGTRLMKRLFATVD